MAAFWGSVTGNTSVASRGGTRDSGIRTSTQSWKGSVGVSFSLVDNEVMVEIAVASDSSSHPRQVLFLGKLAELITAGSLKAQG